MDIVSVFSVIFIVGSLIYFNSQYKKYRKHIEFLNNEINVLKNSLTQLQNKNIPIESNMLSVSSNLITIKKNQSESNKNIDHITEQIGAINNRIDSLSNFFSIGKSLDKKENKKYESINGHIIDDYKNINYRDFLDKYPDYKTIGLLNYDDIRNNRSVPPNFSEVATGHCTAVLIENDLYSIVIKKSLELRNETIESIGISFIFELSEEPIKGFFYGQWELTKLPIFQKLSNDKWVCLSKGYLKLKPNLEGIKTDLETKNNENINDESLSRYTTLTDMKAISNQALDEVINFSQRIFLTRNSEAVSLKSRKYKEKVFFNNYDDGDFYCFYPENYQQEMFNEFYFLFPKAEYLKQIFATNQSINQKENSLLTKIFGFKSNKEDNLSYMKNIEEIFNISYSNNIIKPQINKLAIIKLKKTTVEQKQSYELIEKGKLIL